MRTSKQNRIMGLPFLGIAGVLASAACGVVRVNGKTVAWPGSSQRAPAQQGSAAVDAPAGQRETGSATSAATNAANPPVAVEAPAAAAAPDCLAMADDNRAICPVTAPPSYTENIIYFVPKRIVTGGLLLNDREVSLFRLERQRSGFNDWIGRFEATHARNPELATLALAEYCLKPAQHESGVTRYIPMQEAEPACQILLARRSFNVEAARRTIGQEIYGGGHLYVSIRIAQLPEIITAAKSALDAAAKEEPAVATLAALHDAELKRWQTPDPLRERAIALAAEIRAAVKSGKRSAVADCAARTQPFFAETVNGIDLPPAMFHDERTNHFGLYQEALISNPAAYWAYLAVRACVHSDQTEFYINPSRTLEEPGYIDRFAGPYTSTMAQWMRAHHTLTFDQRGRTVLTILDRDSNLEWHLDRYGADNSRFGKLAAITPDGDYVTLSFKRETAVFDVCAQWQTTNQIVSISNGQVRYREVCVKRSKERQETNPDDVTVTRAAAAGLKPGMMLLLGRDGERTSVLLGALANKLVYFAGGAVN